MSGFKNRVVRGRGVKKSCVEGRMVIEKSCGNDEECIEIVLLKGGSLEIEWLGGGRSSNRLVRGRGSRNRVVRGF